jgi:hypothetical protein
MQRRFIEQRPALVIQRLNVRVIVMTILLRQQRAGRIDPRGVLHADFSSHALARVSARFQPWVILARAAAFMVGLNLRSICQCFAMSATFFQKPTASPGEAGGAERGGFIHLRTHDGHAEEIALHLHEQVVHAGAAIDAEFLQLDARVGLHGLQDVHDLQGDAFERRTRDVRRGGAACHAHERAARIRIPMRSAEAGEGGHEIDAAVVGTLAARASTSAEV